jgi:hypothetical protein
MAYDRRATDKVHSNTLDIDEMIRGEDNEEKRATLMVLSAINTSLVANTLAVAEISSRFEKHEVAFADHRKEFQSHAKDEADVLSQMRGGSKVFMWFIGLLQVVLFSAAAWVFGSLNTLTVELHEIEVSVSAYHSKVDNLVDSHRKTP